MILAAGLCTAYVQSCELTCDICCLACSLTPNAEGVLWSQPIPRRGLPLLPSLVHFHADKGPAPAADELAALLLNSSNV
jgi:hypothetical protein